jgi:hypothetical protein
MIDETTNEELVICQIILIARPEVSLTSQTPVIGTSPLNRTERQRKSTISLDWKTSQLLWFEMSMLH